MKDDLVAHRVELLERRIVLLKELLDAAVTGGLDGIAAATLDSLFAAETELEVIRDVRGQA